MTKFSVTSTQNPWLQKQLEDLVKELSGLSQAKPDCPEDTPPEFSTYQEDKIAMLGTNVDLVG